MSKSHCNLHHGDKAESMGSASPVLYGIVKRFFRIVQENTKTDVYKESKQQIMLNSLSIFLREKKCPTFLSKSPFRNLANYHANTPLTSFNELMYANLHDLLFRFFLSYGLLFGYSWTQK